LEELIPSSNVIDISGDSVKLLDISSVVRIFNLELANERGPFGLDLVSSTFTVSHSLKSDNLVREGKDRGVLGVVGRRVDGVEMLVASHLIQDAAKVSVGVSGGNGIITSNNTKTTISRSSGVTVSLSGEEKACEYIRRMIKGTALDQLDLPCFDSNEYRSD
jgi:hypothetical protein